MTPNADLGTFDTCVDSGKHAVADATTEARARLRKLGAESIGVPTFTVNGQFRRLGIPTLDELRIKLDARLRVSDGVAALPAAER